MEIITTDIFRINAATVSLTLLRLYGKTWTAAAACVVLAMILPGIFLDARWIIVSLMAAFIVFPMLLAFLYFYYGMNPVSVINSTHHRLEFGGAGITVSIYDKEETPPGRATNEAGYIRRSQTKIDYGSFTGYDVGINNVALRTALNGKGFIVVPLATFSDKALFVQAVERVSAGIRRQ